MTSRRVDARTDAALFNGSPGLAGARVGVVVPGGNVDLDRLPWPGEA